MVTEANGRAERQAAVELLSRLRGVGRITLGGGKNYDARAFVARCREMKVTPHVAQNTKGRSSAIDGRTTRHPGYAKPAGEEAGGGDLRLDQDGGRRAQVALHRGSPQPDVGGPDGGCLQPGPDGQIGFKPGLKVGQRPDPGVEWPPPVAETSPL